MSKSQNDFTAIARRRAMEPDDVAIPKFELPQNLRLPRLRAVALRAGAIGFGRRCQRAQARLGP